MARHVGRPTNEEVVSRKKKQIAKIIIPVSIVLVLVVLLSTKGLMGIMGNSVVSTTEKAYLLGDLDNSGNVDIADLTILTKYLTDPDKYKLNEYQLAAANVYKDDSNSVDQEDANALRNFLLGGEQLVGTAGNIGGTVGANYTGDIGAKYVCPASTETVKYELVNTNQCKIETINNKNTEKEIVYKAYNIGDEIIYNGMKFYVIAPSDTKQDYVTLLKDEPLTVDEVNTYGEGHINRYTSSSVGTAYNRNGYGGMAYYSSETCGKVNGSSVYDGCITDYNTSEIKYVVDGWSKATLTQSELKEVEGYKARLLIHGELTTNLGYAKQTGTTPPSSNGETPSWVYSSDYYYWTMSTWNDSASSVWLVYRDGRLNSTGVSNYGNGVVRPVINLKKSAI